MSHAAVLLPSTTLQELLQRLLLKYQQNLSQKLPDPCLESDDDRAALITQLEIIMMCNSLRGYCAQLFEIAPNLPRNTNLLPEKTLNKIVEKGFWCISDATLLFIAFSPLTLADIQIQIEQRRSEYWVDRMEFMAKVKKATQLCCSLN